MTFVLSMVAGTQLVRGLAEDRIGPDKDHPHPTHEQPGWPRGLVKILQHDARVYSVWVNGNETFYFKATPAEIGDLLARFAETRLRDHVVVIKAGPQEVKPFDVPKGIPYNVRLDYLDGIALFMARREGGAETHEPTFTIYVSPGDEREELKRIEFPDNVAVRSEVAEWPVGAKAVVPARALRHALLQFEGGKPATDFESGVLTKVTWWEEDEEDPIHLGGADRDGYFHVALSEGELEALRAGRAWLTLTVGNQLRKPERGDARLAVESLAPQRDLAKPVQVGSPGYHHGRILFEDGTPAILDPEPWPGGQLSISFPYAGAVGLEADGSFRVSFSPEQFAEVSAEKIRKNVYVPSFEERGRSTALHAFPAGKLSRDPAKPGEIRIARPGPAGKDG